MFDNLIEKVVWPLLLLLLGSRIPHSLHLAWDVLIAGVPRRDLKRRLDGIWYSTYEFLSPPGTAEPVKETEHQLLQLTLSQGRVVGHSLAWVHHDNTLSGRLVGDSFVGTWENHGDGDTYFGAFAFRVTQNYRGLKGSYLGSDDGTISAGEWTLSRLPEDAKAASKDPRTVLQRCMKQRVTTIQTPSVSIRRSPRWARFRNVGVWGLVVVLLVMVFVNLFRKQESLSTTTASAAAALLSASADHRYRCGHGRSNRHRLLAS